MDFFQNNTNLLSQPNHSKNGSFCVGLDALKGLEMKQSVIVEFFVATLIVQWIVISQSEFKLNTNPCSLIPLYLQFKSIQGMFKTQNIGIHSFLHRANIWFVSVFLLMTLDL